MKIRIKPFTWAAWAVYAATLETVVCAYVAILRFGFGIHEKSSLLIDMIIFNFLVSPLTFGSLLGYVASTSLILLLQPATVTTKTQGKWAAFAALLTSLGVLSRFAEILGNYLRWFGFRIVPGEMQGWLTVGIVIGASSGAFARFTAFVLEFLFQYLKGTNPESRTA